MYQSSLNIEGGDVVKSRRVSWGRRDMSEARNED